MSTRAGRYAASVASLIERLEPLRAGTGFVIVPSTEHALIAAELAAQLPPALGMRVGTLEEAAAQATQVPLRLIVTGLPTDGRATKLLTEVNGRRDFIRIHGGFLVLLISSSELMVVHRWARDLHSARSFLEIVPFEPDMDIDEEEARRSLARYHEERFGRLDLRGFIRSEEEDVSFSVDEIFQDLEASLMVKAPERGEAPLRDKQPIQRWLSTLDHDRPFVVLGHPGSGKTFLLRWLALAAATCRNDVDIGVAAPLPVLVSLAAYSQAPQMEGLLHNIVEMLLVANQPAAHLVGRAIAARQAVFLLDGLDELVSEAGRRLILAAIQKLHAQAPGCLIIITSRIAGYGPDTLTAHHLMLSPFGNERIRRFLCRWCELYAVSRLGGSEDARSKGRLEGDQLANDVIANPGLRALAGNPLLLTMLAIVHRAGVRLPDHRVELYAHATTVLVERWNRVRSLSGADTATPLKAADAVRLLGPLALEMIEKRSAAVVTEEVLREHVNRALKAGTVRGVADSGEVIALFRNALGLLVEQAPGVYTFLHLTLAEYFAAWELLRSDELDRLAADPTRAYLAHNREVILLAAGELGVLRADDARLDQLVETLVESARKRINDPSHTVPSLLAGLLADDPHLTTDAAQLIVGELIPTWWFNLYLEKNTTHGDVNFALDQAIDLVGERIHRGRFMHLVRARVEKYYGQKDLIEDLLEVLQHWGRFTSVRFFSFLDVCRVDY